MGTVTPKMLTDLYEVRDHYCTAVHELEFEGVNESRLEYHRDELNKLDALLSCLEVE
jgi:hypothetical protein